MQLVTLAACSLNQWALDFSGNLARIRESIVRARAAGAAYRLGPELEVTGYGCNDHFLEEDTVIHSWEVLAELLSDDACTNIVCDVGMPVIYRGILYNCRVMFYNKRILLIRPKMHLANDGNYREMRWFTPWSEPRTVHRMVLPDCICQATHDAQQDVDFGDGVISFMDVKFGTELCEELFTPNSPHIQMSLDGIEIFTNGSASHHEFRKLTRRIDLIRNATDKCGGVYMYSNQKGCDGERVYYDGCPLIVVNGHVVAQGAQFSIADVEVVTAIIDLQAVRAYRAGLISRALQASLSNQRYPLVHVPKSLTRSNLKSGQMLARSIQPTIYSPEEEIRFGPACWLWDYLRRTKAAGFFLPLSGGIDSCATALIVFSMCELVHHALEQNDNKARCDLEDIVGSKHMPNGIPTPQEICSLLLHTCYMGTSNSSTETQNRASLLAKCIGSYHLSINMDKGIDALMGIFMLATGHMPNFSVYGGTTRENLALQNVQARIRMVAAYLFAQLLPWTRNDRRGSLLVLGSANVDETLRGYLTKYDCSSADVNPIGGISKHDLNRFVRHMRDTIPSLKDVLTSMVEAKSTAELEPITETHMQTDEADMGMTYSDLSVFGTLRKVCKMGPVSMLRQLLIDWADIMSPAEICSKVKSMFFFYAINRHKTTVLPPSYHMSSYSPDDNRFDLRPFLYNAGWTWQFGKMDKVVAENPASDAAVDSNKE